MSNTDWDTAVEQRVTLDIVIPTGRHRIARGSGCVISPKGEKDGWSVVYFEGFTVGAGFRGDVDESNPWAKWCEGVIHAAGRAVVDYPTTAKAVMNAGEYVVVGHYTCGGEIDVTRRDLLEKWLSEGN